MNKHLDKQCKHNNNGWCEQKGKSCLTEKDVKECGIYECNNTYKIKENRIYLDGKLVNICCNEFALMCNYNSYKKKYGDRITTRVVDSDEDVEEKEEWLKGL